MPYPLLYIFVLSKLSKYPYVDTDSTVGLLYKNIVFACRVAAASAHITYG